jgi:hypothetical protein
MSNNATTIAVIVVAFIAQLIASLVAVFVGRPRNNQPKPIPDPNQPKNRSQRIMDWFMRLFESRWKLPLLYVLLYTYGLLREFRDTRPVTRWAILQISMAVGGIIWAAVTALVNSLARAMKLGAEAQAAVDRGLLDLIQTLRDWTKESGENQHAINKSLLASLEALIAAQPSQTEPDKATEGKLHKLLGTLKHLFGD